MKVKIAAFGGDEIIDRLSALVENQQDVEIVSFTYEKEQETIELIEKAFMCDIYIFTDSLSYLYVKKKIEKKRLPAVLVPHDELLVLASLYQLKDITEQKNQRLSIDIEDKTIVDKVIQDINISKHNVHIYDYGLDSEISTEKIIEHHISLWEKGQIDYVITTVKSIERQLSERNIPTLTMRIPDINFEKAIEQAKARLKLDLSMSAQVVTGYIQIKNHEKYRNEVGEKSLKGNMVTLQEILTKFSKKTDISVFSVSDYQLVLFGTKALNNHLTNHYRDFPLLREIKSEVKLPVAIGYGLGLTAKQSDVNAKIAIETSSKNEDSKCYIVNERQETIGPIGVKKEFDASKLYHSLIHKARLNNELSYNFIDFIRTRNNEPFSSNDIANYYNVTKRSAERTVNKLLTGEVIKVSGEERPYQKGRPRKLFTLNQ